MDGDGNSTTGPQRVAAIIPCHDARNYIAATVRACRAIPAVDLIVVVDDGSTDGTAQVARSAGAVAVRHSVARGRASALETGVKVVAMRDRADWPARNILFLTDDLGDSAIEANALVEAVNSGLADCAVGVPPSTEGTRPSATSIMAWKGIRQTTGWDSTGPLSLHRCLTREAVSAAMPFANGWGADVGMTVDLLNQGFSIVEIPCNFHHLGEHQPEPRGFRRNRYWDIWWTIRLRKLTRHRVPLAQRVINGAQTVGDPYQMRERSRGPRQ